MTSPTKLFDRCVIFSGGGTRFGVFCGMYAAVEQTVGPPDLVAGACGGGIAATVIDAFATNAERAAYLESEELYRFIRDTKLTRERKLNRLGLYCAGKLFNGRRAPRIENVFDRYLVEMPQDLSADLPSLAGAMGRNQRTIITGSRMLFDKSECGEPRRGRKLYERLYFTDPETARLIGPEAPEIHSENFRQSAATTSARVRSDLDALTVMRISLSDMFYVPPVDLDGVCYAGGTIDLVPIELASALCERVVIERKQPFTPVEEALVRAVLGFSGNARLREATRYKADKVIDTSDQIEALAGHYCQQKIDWRKAEVGIVLPVSHARFAEDMRAQWKYGYDKAMEQFKP